MDEFDRFGFRRREKGDDILQNKNDVPTSVTRRREKKWMNMLEPRAWDTAMKKRRTQVKRRCRKGIPQSLRGLAWQHLSGSHILMNQSSGQYETLLTTEDTDIVVNVIDKDVFRTFPEHQLFTEEHGQQDLRNVLKAYSVYDSQTGYCQAMGPIAATLLMHMPAEQAFWCLVRICHKYMNNYFGPQLEAVQLDACIFDGLLSKLFPKIRKHLATYNVHSLFYMTEWFMCIYVRTLPWPLVLRVLDIFFCEGIKVLFQVGLVLLNMAFGTVEKRSRYTSLQSITDRLKELPHELDHEGFIQEVLALKLNKDDLVREHMLQLSQKATSSK
ncbi:TBC1 domain family member 10A-like [Corticium candelabrum]|uniref:TBC1 domain family member 10A-like n=1 Tax=Corticium candelabrum TaxID=121492 RepID=UPI002E25EFA5|nr:TBC1 domain family member 10A-like [Corticium candelabrum]